MTNVCGVPVTPYFSATGFVTPVSDAKAIPLSFMNRLAATSWLVMSTATTSNPLSRYCS
jgi:hypothetical protein